MYPASGSFQAAVWQDTRNFKRRVIIETAENGTFTFDEEDLRVMTIKDSFVTGNQIEVGSAVSKQLDITLDNLDGTYDSVFFAGAIIDVDVNLDDIEWIPMGRFYVDEAPRPGKLIQIIAFDAMIRFDRWFTSVVTPTTPLLLLNKCCQIAGIQLHTTSFPNDTYNIPEVPPDKTCRQILQMVAQLAGRNAHITRDNKLELLWYSSSGQSINKHNVYSLTHEEEVTVTGVEYVFDETTYMSGEEGYVLSLKKNELITHSIETVVSAWGSSVVGTSFYPGRFEHQGNPCWDPGDLVEVTDDKDVTRLMSVGENNYSFNGFKCTTVSAAEAKDRAGYAVAGLLSSRMSEIRKIINDEINDEVTARELAIENATSLFLTMMGGNVLHRENEVLIMDDPDPEQAVKVWRWSMAGIGYSDNVTGVDNPERIYTTALTMDGSLVANWINAFSVNADLITVGTLDAGRIAAETITAYHINTTGLVADEALIAHLYSGSIHANQIDAGTIAAEYLATDIAQVYRMINIGHPELVDFRQINFIEVEELGTLYKAQIQFDPTIAELAITTANDIRINSGLDILVTGMGMLLPSLTYLGGYAQYGEEDHRVATRGWVNEHGGGGGGGRQLVDIQFYGDGMITEYDNGDVVNWGFLINEQGYITLLENSEGREIVAGWHEEEFLFE